MPSIASQSASSNMTRFLILANSRNNNNSGSSSSSLSMDSSQRSTFSVNSPSIIGRKNVTSVRPNEKNSNTLINNKRKNNTHSVRFNPLDNSVHEVWPRKNLSREDISELWYSVNDIKVIKSRLNTTIRMMKSGRFNNEVENSSESFSFRGVLTDEDKSARRDRVAQHQMELFWCGDAREYFEMPEIPLILQEHSRCPTEEAILRAKRDQEEAFKIYGRTY